MLSFIVKILASKIILNLIKFMKPTIFLKTKNVTLLKSIEIITN